MSPLTSTRASLRRIATAILATVAIVAAWEPRAAHAAEPESASAPDARIEWLDDLDEALALAKAQKKPVVLEFAAAWCASCRQFASSTLPAPEVQAFAGKFIWVKIDIDRDATTARAHRVEVTPSFELLDAAGVTRVRIEGVRSPKDFAGDLGAFRKSLETPPAGGIAGGGGSPGSAAPPTLVPAEDRTDLTWSPDGFRALSICFSNVGYGPLHLTSQSSFQSLRFGFQPRTPSTISRGVIEARLTETWSNLFAKKEAEPEYIVDFEILRTDLAISYGLTDTIELEVEFVDKSRFGGHLDGFIEGFHSTMGLTQGGRDEVPRDKYRFHVESRDGSRQFTGTSGTGSFSRDLLFTFQHNLTCGDELLPAFAYAGTLDVELGRPSDMDDNQPVSLGGSISASKRFFDFYAYASLGIGYFGDETLRGGIKLRPVQLSGLLALEWRFTATMSVVAQYLVNQGVAEGAGPFSEPAHEIDGGVKWEFMPGWLFELGFVENIINFDNSPDFGFHVGLTVRF